MGRHTEQLVGALFHILDKEGHSKARQELIKAYQSQAPTNRDDLVNQLTAEMVATFHRHLTEQEEVTVLTTTIEHLVEQFVAIIEVAPVAIIVVDEDGRVRLWNDGAERMFGWSEDTVLARPYADLLLYSPSTHETILSQLEDQDRVTGVETQHYHKDGSVLDVRVWAAPLRNTNSSLTSATFVISDITAQKQREQHLAVLNRVLRHNIRNEIMVIRGHLEMLSKTVETDNEHLEVIEERLTNIIELSEDARHIEQLQPEGQTDTVTHDLDAVLQNRLDRLRKAWPEATVTLRNRVPVAVTANNLLPYAIDNILENAVEHNDAANPRICVDVSVESRHDSDMVDITIADNGPGLPPNETEILTTETETPLNHSTGTGLWLTRWIVRSSGGQITVTSNRFDGTTVSTSLRRSGD